MKKRKGVSLIELLIVILILASLAAIAVPRIIHSVQTTNDQVNEKNLDHMNMAIEQYFIRQGSYPTNAAEAQNAISTNEYFPDGMPQCVGDFVWSWDNSNKRYELVPD
jgi:general secretion pathway protein G